MLREVVGGVVDFAGFGDHERFAVAAEGRPERRPDADKALTGHSLVIGVAGDPIYIVVARVEVGDRKLLHGFSADFGTPYPCNIADSMDAEKVHNMAKIGDVFGFFSGDIADIGRGEAAISFRVGAGVSDVVVELPGETYEDFAAEGSYGVGGRDDDAVVVDAICDLLEGGVDVVAAAPGDERVAAFGYIVKDGRIGCDGR